MCFKTEKASGRKERERKGDTAFIERKKRVKTRALVFQAARWCIAPLLPAFQKGDGHPEQIHDAKGHNLCEKGILSSMFLVEKLNKTQIVHLAKHSPTKCLTCHCPGEKKGDETF